ncbi:MAG: phosphoenolpyruvate--protein phosphotransferase [Geobacteraceae bacterium]|nr:phosphoenolpyruvate--protein phosphotransferase [Geobacteraceae bacterium]
MVLERSKNLCLSGVPASPGIAIGLARVTDRARVAVSEHAVKPEAVPAEITRLLEAISEAKEELLLIKNHLEKESGSEHLYILDTHLMILEDPMLTSETVSCIKTQLINAEGSLRRTLLKFREFFNAIEDEYLRERGSDVDIVGERILRKMVGFQQEPLPQLDSKVIIIAHDLSPTDVLQIDKSKVIAFVTDLGGKTSHTAILARALGIPAVVGLESATAEIISDDSIIIDGATGTVVINPSDESFRNYLSRKQRYEYFCQEYVKFRDLPAETVDGHRIRLKGNLEFIEEVPALKEHGGEGVGLYRTEMLYMNRSTLPDEEEQFEAYLSMCRKVAPFPVSIRTLDVGGDKFVPELNLADELNPALGLRAIRLSLRNIETFKPQVRAILRASAFGEIRMFFPMISGVSEIREVKRIISEVKYELRSQGITYDDSIKIGIMIEIPSAVLVADQLAKEVDFFSVGTNDLIQYTLAIDRTNEHLSHLYQPLNPAIIRSLQIVADAAHQAGIEACICGEMAGEPQYLPILLGLGFDELSMTPPSIPRVKEILRRCSLTEAKKLTAKILEAETAEAVESILKSELTAHFSEGFD